MLSFFFQVPFFLAIICFFGSVGAGEAVREIHHNCPGDCCRQLLGHFTPIAGAGSATQLIKELSFLQIGSITSCGWQGSCSRKIGMMCSWEASNCNKMKEKLIRSKLHIRNNEMHTCLPLVGIGVVIHLCCGLVISTCCKDNRPAIVKWAIEEGACSTPSFIAQ